MCTAKILQVKLSKIKKYCRGLYYIELAPLVNPFFTFESTVFEDACSFKEGRDCL